MDETFSLFFLGNCKYLSLSALLPHMECRHLGEACRHSAHTKGGVVAEIPAKGTQYTTLNCVHGRFGFLANCTIVYVIIEELRLNNFLVIIEVVLAFAFQRPIM